MFEDALKDSWAYQEIWQGGKQEGIEQGKQEGLLEGIQLGKREGIQLGKQEGIQLGKQEGIEQGKLEERLADAQRQRHMLEFLVEQDFPALLPLAKKRGGDITDPDALQDIILQLLRAGSDLEARQILSE